MASYLMRRVFATLPTAALIVLAVVLLIRVLPGNVVDVRLAEQGNTSPEARAALEHQLGLDKNPVEAYLDYLGGVVRGDLGRSFGTDEPVSDLIFARLPVTMEIVVSGLLLGLIFGVFAGAFSASRRGTSSDQVVRIFSIIFLSLPPFAVATGVVVLPVLWWGWSPPVTYTAFSESPWAHIQQLIAPALVLALASGAVVMRFSRTTFLDVLGGDFVRTARAKGLLSRTVLLRHALPNALIPVLTLVGVQVGALFSGSVVIETIFGIPGLGRLLISALGTRDYPVLQGMTLVTGIGVLMINLIVDMLYPVIDPRVKLQ